MCVEDATICEGYLYIVVDNYIQPMGGVITIDITITGCQLRKVFEFTENLPPARDGDLQKHVIALDTFRDSMS